MATEKKKGEHEEVVMDRGFVTDGVRVADEKPEGQNVSDRSDDVAAAIRAVEEKHTSELRLVLNGVDSVLRRLDHVEVRMTTTQGRMDALIGRENEAAASVREAVTAMQKQGVQHLDDLRMVLKLVDKLTDINRDLDR